MTLQTVLHDPSVAHAVVVVDVGPELSAKGAKVIGDFIAHNIEFDDLDVFLENVARYDRFRSREDTAFTIKYNLLFCRFYLKYVSKVDHRRLPGSMREITLDAVAAIGCPVLVVRGGESDVLTADAAERFVAALPVGRLVTVAERRPQRARRQHARVPRGHRAVPGHARRAARRCSRMTP